MANCFECEHMMSGPEDAWALGGWPCEKGVASLPTKTPAYKEAEAQGLLMFMGQTHYQKLPWMIDNHECPEFEEVEG